MKPRKVVVTLELLTDLPMVALKARVLWEAAVEAVLDDTTVEQVSANVVRPSKPRGRAARKAAQEGT